MNPHPKYPELAEAVAAMEVGDCLRWTELPDLPDDRAARAITATTRNYGLRKGLETHQFVHRPTDGKPTLYVVRVA